MHRNNKCAQVFALDFRWICVYPMKSKGKAHESSPLMFQHEGVPLSMLMDGSKEQTLGKFYQKLVGTHCQLEQTELYSPWQNVTERDIKELKKSSGHKMLATGASQQLWNDCLDLEACIHSHSTNSVYHIDGKVTEMYVSRETVDIIYTFLVHSQ